MRKLLLAALWMMMAACASTTVQAPATTSSAPPPPKPGAIDDAVKDAVAEQLNCPKDQIIFLCDEYDRTGECIAIHAKGCDRELAYKFGTE